jgi:hypothetical protein
MKFGLAGPFDGFTFPQLRKAGVSFVLIEMAPTQIAGALRQADAATAAGLEVVVNLGYFQLPGSGFVDEHGTTSAGLDLMWSVDDRQRQQDYVTATLPQFKNAAMVRVGCSAWGEQMYPKTGTYWGFSDSAMLYNPVPHWRPGQLSPDREAAKFLNWYLDCLVIAQNWQISVIRRAGFRKRCAVLYPSFGMQPGDLEAAVATNLNGSTSAERNGEVQAGIDHARGIRGLTDSNTAIWCTWADNPDVVANLAKLRGKRVLMGENSGDSTDRAGLDRIKTNAAAHGLDRVMWIRASTLRHDTTVGLNDLVGA